MVKQTPKKTKSKSTYTKKVEKYPCTHGDMLSHVITLDGEAGNTCRIWAGGAHDVRDAIDYQEVPLKLTVSLGGTTTRSMAKPSNKTKWAPIRTEGDDFGLLDGLPESPKIEAPPAIVIDWPDMGIPNYPLEWWEKLVDNLWKFDGDVAFHCHGGHGRTGTALAIIAHLTGVTEGKDPVDWLREHYCKHTVESKSQVNYLNELGVGTDAEPCKGSYTSSNYPIMSKSFIGADEGDGHPFPGASSDVGKDACVMCFSENDDVQFDQEEMCYLCSECGTWARVWANGGR